MALVKCVYVYFIVGIEHDEYKIPVSSSYCLSGSSEDRECHTQCEETTAAEDSRIEVSARIRSHHRQQDEDLSA